MIDDLEVRLHQRGDPGAGMRIRDQNQNVGIRIVAGMSRALSGDGLNVNCGSCHMFSLPFFENRDRRKRSLHITLVPIRALAFQDWLRFYLPAMPAG